MEKNYIIVFKALHSIFIQCCNFHFQSHFVSIVLYLVIHLVTKSWLCNESELKFVSSGTDDAPVTYTNGIKDFCTIFFYSLAWIVVHAIIQEYIWDVCGRYCFETQF